tara:strand:+ start:339 stop:815 length:477 start_codon:yes stop_codon:yes gene_type:complete
MKYVILMIALMLSTNAFAQSNCYTASEFEAEQGLRIHSELMVVSLNCQHMNHVNGNLYMQYKDFTRRHAGLIARYESTMKDYYTRTGASNPESDVNALRTQMANKIANDAARMKPNVFCKAYGNRIIQALSMDEAKLRRWAATPFRGHPVSHPMCTAG